MRWLYNYSHRGQGVFGKATLVSKRKIISLGFAWLIWPSQVPQC